MKTKEDFRIEINEDRQVVEVGKHEIDFATIFHIAYKILESSENLAPGCTCLEFLQCLKSADIVSAEKGMYTIKLPFERHCPT